MNFQDKRMKQPGNFFNKNIVTVLIIGAVAFLVWKFRGIFSQSEKLSNPFSTLSLLRSKSKAELDTIADIQEMAMGDNGTDEDTLFNSLEGLNKYDLKELLNSFGKRKYLSLFGTKGYSFTGTNISLMEWYLNELSGKDLQRMRDIWKKAEIIF